MGEEIPQLISFNNILVVDANEWCLSMKVMSGLVDWGCYDFYCLGEVGFGEQLNENSIDVKV